MSTTSLRASARPAFSPSLTALVAILLACALAVLVLALPRIDGATPSDPALDLPLDLVVAGMP